VNSQVGQKSEGRGGEEKPENDKKIFNFKFMEIKKKIIVLISLCFGVIENVINFLADT
jgi:hypothetical protein